MPAPSIAHKAPRVVRVCAQAMLCWYMPCALVIILCMASLVLAALGRRMVLLPTEPAIARMLEDGCTLVYVVHGDTQPPKFIRVLMPTCDDYGYPGADGEDDDVLQPGDTLVVYHSRLDPSAWALASPPPDSGGFWLGIVLLSTAVVTSVLATTLCCAYCVFNVSLPRGQQQHMPSPQQQQQRGSTVHQQQLLRVVVVADEAARSGIAVAHEDAASGCGHDVFAYMIVQNPH